MPELVALDLPAGQGFVDALRRAWDDGNAVLPLDPRLARPAVDGCSTPSGRGRGRGDGDHRRTRAAYPTEPDDALVVATSGTTGEPEGSRADPRRRPASAARHLGPPGGRTRPRPVAGLPAAGPYRRALGRDAVAGHGHPLHGARAVRRRRGGAAGPARGHPGLAGGHGPRRTDVGGLPGRAPGWGRPARRCWRPTWSPPTG